jgi:pumilio RNA-binding family
VAQAALDAAGEGEGLELAAELRGRIREALGSPHANFVVQRIVEVLPPAEVDFIVEELTGAAVETAQHRFGCRVLCRLLEHCPHSQTECLVKEILGEAAVLCRHSYGHYVVRHILELGTSWQKRALVEAFVKDPLGLASHRCGSSVVEHALEHASEEDRQVLIRALLRDANSFARLASTRYGSYVARTLSRLRGKDTAEERMFAVATTQKVRACRRSKRLTAHEQATRYEVSVSA